MAPSIPFGHPSSFRAGDTVAWRITFPDFPVGEGWALSYKLGPIGSTPINWTAGWVTDDGAEWTVTLLPATTATLTAGVHALTPVLTLDGAVYSQPSHYVTVAPSTGGTTRDAEVAAITAQIVKIDSEIAALIPGTGAGHESYQVGDRGIIKQKLGELRKQRSALVVRKQAILNGGRIGHVILDRYVPVGCSGGDPWPG